MPQAKVRLARPCTFLSKLMDTIGLALTINMRVSLKQRVVLSISVAGNFVKTKGFLFHLERGLKRHVFRRIAHVNYEFARIYFPGMGLHIPVSERPAVQCDGDALRLTRIKGDALEALQFFDRTRNAGRGIAHVNLGNLGAGKLAGVGDVKADSDRRANARLRGRNAQMAKVKRRVGEAETKGEQRLHRAVVVVTVAEKDPLAVDDIVSARLFIVVFVAGIILLAALPTDRQFAKGVESEEDFRQRRTRLRTTIPAFDQHRHAIEPSTGFDASARG